MTDIVKLPEPQKELPFPLMRAIEKRRTRRRWKKEPLSQQDISNILWVACGKTMKATKKRKSRRTIPSSRNSQAMKVYIALEQGLFRYDDNTHSLVFIKTDDIRAHCTNQKMMKNMPAGLVYIADFLTLKGYIGKDEHQKLFVAGTETGFMSQNVYLYCASAGLSTAVIGLVNRPKLHETMGLADYERVVFTQAVGKNLEI